MHGTAIDKVAASIKEFGFRQPIVVDAEGVIIAGHARYEAARRLGLAAAPVHVAEGLTPAQVKAYRLADNRVAQEAQWDNDLLGLEFEDLKGADFDLALTGFEGDEIEALFAGDERQGVTGDDDIPALEEGKPPVTQPGDLWLMGAHRLLCGDATIEAQVARLMDERRAVLLATDPPYGVSHVATKDGIPRSGFADMAKRWEHIKNDDLEDNKLQEFLERAFRAALNHALTENAAWYLWHAHLTQGFFAAAAAAAADVLLHRQIIWKKPGFVLTRSGQYHWAHEPCFYGWRRGHPPPWYGDKSQTSVWEIGRDQGGLHPTQKPVALWDAPVQNHSHPSEILYEPFAGSGSQFIAAEKSERTCYGLELSEHYCDVIVRRWQAYTGKEATLDGDGRTFAMLAEARKAAACPAGVNPNRRGLR